MKLFLILLVFSLGNLLVLRDHNRKMVENRTEYRDCMSNALHEGWAQGELLMYQFDTGLLNVETVAKSRAYAQEQMDDKTAQCEKIRKKIILDD